MVVKLSGLIVQVLTKGLEVSLFIHLQVAHMGLISQNCITGLISGTLLNLQLMKRLFSVRHNLAELGVFIFALIAPGISRYMMLPTR